MRVDYDKNKFTYTQADIDEWMERLAIRNKEYEQLERERDEARKEFLIANDKMVEAECRVREIASVLERVKRERDEAREKIKRQAERIRELEGSTNHACGTPLSVALRERDKARKELEEYRSIAENIGAKKAVSEKEQAIRERDELLNEIKRLRLDAQREAEHHDRMVGELEKVYKERDDALKTLKAT